MYLINTVHRSYWYNANSDVSPVEIKIVSITFYTIIEITSIVWSNDRYFFFHLMEEVQFTNECSIQYKDNIKVYISTLATVKNTDKQKAVICENL